MKNQVILGLVGVAIVLALAVAALGPMLATPEGQLFLNFLGK